MALILDTGPLYGSLDANDSSYTVCRQLLRDTTERLVIPVPVLIEVDQLVSSQLYPAVFVAFMDDIVAGAYEVVDLITADYRRVRELCDRYADSDIGFVDAAVLAIVERLNEPKLATLDRRHFGTMRPRHVDSLLLLPA